MKEFIEKWNNEPKFKAKAKLAAYTLFVVIVSIFAISTGRNDSISNISEIDNDTNYKEDTTVINIPKEYNYTINITINDNKYKYIGKKISGKEEITKIVNDVNTNYIYQKNNYYKQTNEEYVLINKNDVYDIVDYNYINLDIINQYLSKSKKENNKNIVYLKDIILGNDSEKYITISIDNSSTVNIDYTELIKNFNESVENYIVEIIIEEIE